MNITERKISEKKAIIACITNFFMGMFAGAMFALALAHSSISKHCETNTVYLNNKYVCVIESEEQ